MNREFKEMANPQQLGLLKQGPKVWNQWRETNPRQHLSLKGVNLQGAYLTEVNFWNVDLSNADLSNATLRGANLRDADLSNTNLAEADLTGLYLEFGGPPFGFLPGANLRNC